MTVCFPYSPVDQDLALTLASWMRELGQNKDHSCLIVRDKRCNLGKDEQIRKELEQTFVSVETITAPAEIDGWPQGPNHLFQTAARHIQFNQQSPWIWLEADCVVLKPDWIDQLMNEYNQKRKPFLGDFVHVPNVPDHMSGIAVYPGMVVEYAGNALITQNVAWDVSSADQVLPNMATTKLIQHKWKHPPLENQSQVDNLLSQLGDDCVLFHADKSGSLIQLLRERKLIKTVATTAASIVSHDPTIRYVKKDNGFVQAPTCAIFIKSCPADYKWLGYCLRSITKFCSGFGRCSIVVPEVTEELRSAVPGNDKIDFRIESRHEYGLGNPAPLDFYLSQQVFKLNADTFTQSDYICFIDSDTIFTKPVAPETYFKDGKPIWMITPIDQAHADEQHAWRRVMQKFIGKEPEYEYMRRFPFVLPRWLLQGFRDFCQKQHGMNIEQYVMSQPYREYSEFNCLGFYAWEFYRDKFTWIDTSKVPEKDWPELTVDQRWSHNPIPKDEWEAILGGTETTTGGKDHDTNARPAAVPPKIAWSGNPSTAARYEIKDGKYVQVDSPKSENQTPNPNWIPCDQPPRQVSLTSRTFGSAELIKQLESERILKPMREPWKDKKDSEKEVRLLCEALAMFCAAPVYKKRVRDALRESNIIK